MLVRPTKSHLAFLVLLLAASLWLVAPPSHAQSSSSPSTYNSVTSSTGLGARKSTSAPAVCRECGVVRTVVEKRGRGSSWQDSLGNNPTAGMTERRGSIEEDSAAARNQGPATAKSEARSKDESTRTYTRETHEGSSGRRTRATEDNGGEEQTRKRTWQVMVAMEDGNLRVIEYERRPGVQAGDKVKVVGRSVFVR
jgi:hypothetical protein